MKKQLLSSLSIVMLILAVSANTAAAQEQPTIYRAAAPADTLTGIKFTSLPVEQQASLRKEFEEHGIKVEDDALVFFAKKKKDATTVLKEENGKLLNYSFPKGSLYMVPDREAVKKMQLRGPQRIYTTS